MPTCETVQLFCWHNKVTADAIHEGLNRFGINYFCKLDGVESASHFLHPPPPHKKQTPAWSWKNLESFMLLNLFGCLKSRVESPTLVSSLKQGGWLSESFFTRLCPQRWDESSHDTLLFSPMIRCPTCNKGTKTALGIPGEVISRSFIWTVTLGLILELPREKPQTNISLLPCSVFCPSDHC